MNNGKGQKMKNIETQKNVLIEKYYKGMIEPLNCKQFREIMGKNYTEMPAIIRKVTKNKTVLHYAAALEYVVTGESKFLDQFQKHNINTAMYKGIIKE